MWPRMSRRSSRRRISATAANSPRHPRERQRVQQRAPPSEERRARAGAGPPRTRRRHYSLCRTEPEYCAWPDYWAQEDPKKFPRDNRRRPRPHSPSAVRTFMGRFSWDVDHGTIRRDRKRIRTTSPPPFCVVFILNVKAFCSISNLQKILRLRQGGPVLPLVLLLGRNHRNSGNDKTKSPTRNIGAWGTQRTKIRRDSSLRSE